MKTPCQCVSSSAAAPPSDNANAGNSKKRGREGFAATSLGPELNAPLNQQATVNTGTLTAKKTVSIDQLKELMKANCERTKRSRAADSDSLSHAVAALGTEIVVPTGDCISDARKLNMALLRQIEMERLNRRQITSSTIQRAPKPFKFDPPTFHFGSTPSIPDMKQVEESKPAVPMAMPPLNSFNTLSYYDSVSAAHFASSGINWAAREMDLLVECSNRWIDDLKRRKIAESYKVSDSCMSKSQGG